MKLSIQSGRLTNTFGLEAAYRLIRDCGFEAIDWNIDTSWKFKEVCAAEELKDLCIFEKPLEEILEHYAQELAIIRQNG